jgi:16S rRNA U516 pseudouridylate synthase RsuA-like enzyme
MSANNTLTRVAEKAPQPNPGLKRYNLVLPEGLFEEVQRVADARQVSVVELLRRFIKLGLVAVKVEEKDDATLVIKEGDKEREIMLY